MHLSARDFEKSLPQAIKGKRVVVLVGDNIQIKGDLFRLLRRSLSIEADDPFRFVQLDSDALDADPSRLGDELGAISMFGGSRLIRAMTTPRQAESILEVADKAPEGEWLLIVDTEELARPQSNGGVLVVACASEKGGDFHAFVRAEFERAGVRLEEGALEFLVPLLGDDRAAARGEVEKLALLADTSKPITLDDVRSVVADASTLVADEIAVAALSGNLAALNLALNRLGSTGSDATAALGAASRQVLNLFRGRANQWKGRPDQPLQGLSTADLRSLALSLQTAILQTRSDGANAALVAERALVSLGNAVRTRRR